MATLFEVRDHDKRVTTIKNRQVFTDSDWACDQVTRKKHEWCSDHGRGHAVTCSQSWSGGSGVEQLRGGSGRSVGRHHGGVVVARSVDVRGHGTT